MSLGFIKIAASSPTLYLDSCTNFFHHAFYIILELDTERAVIPCVGKASVYFRTGKDEALFLARATIFSIVISLFIPDKTYLFFL